MNEDIIAQLAECRFFGLTTKKGQVHNAQYLGSTDTLLHFWDRNKNTINTLNKASVAEIRADRQEHSFM